MKRLTEKNDKKYFNEHIRCLEYNNYDRFIKDRPYRIDYHSTEVETKLGLIEDLLEKYKINSIEDLEVLLISAAKIERDKTTALDSDKRIKDLTVYEIVTKFCGTYGWEGCEGCPFYKNDQCIRLLDLSIIDINKKVKVRN